ncbi:hypothetical protein D3C72_2560030 [compost metagenome]
MVWVKHQLAVIKGKMLVLAVVYVLVLREDKILYTVACLSVDSLIISVRNLQS